MGGQSLFASPLDHWKERRLSGLSNTTCGTFMSQNSPNSDTHDVESVYTTRSSVSSHRGRRTRSRSHVSSAHRISLPTFPEGDERFSMIPVTDAPLSAPVETSPAAKMFTTSTVRVWKQTPHATWMNVFVPRHIRLQAGSHPFLEYSRQENGPIRQRVYLSTSTRLDRLPKNKLEIDFQTPTASFTDNATTLDASKFTPSKDLKESRKRGEENKCSGSSSSSVKWVLRFETKQERDAWAKKIQDTIDLLAWIDKFTIGQILMESGNSTLAECFSWLDQGVPSYIVKAMPTDSARQVSTARQEIRVHHMLTNFSSHPNVLALHDSYRQQERAYLVLEYCAGGDLFDYIRKDGGLDEVAAKVLFRRIIEAISYIHEHNVVHLDIKPENLLFKTSPADLESIKLADFGSAQLVSDPSGVVKSTVSCTIGYAAPEVLENGDVSFAADIFSAGAVLYTILSGFAPFQSPSDEEALEKTLTGDFSFDYAEWDHVSSLAKDLICGMLEIDPRERLSMDEVLAHP